MAAPKSHDPPSPLRRAASALAGLGLDLHTSAWFERRRPEVLRGVRAALSAGAIDTSAGTPAQDDLQAHAVELLDALLQQFRTLCTPAGSSRPTVASDEQAFVRFVREHAQRSAAQRQPVESTLLAYRRLQAPLLACARQVAMLPPAPRRRAALAALDAWVQEWLAGVGIAFASAHAAQAGLVAEAEGERRTELLNLLLGGHDAGDARVARLLKRSGYLEQRLSFCVALAQSTDPLEMEHPGRAQRIADAMAACVAPLSVRALVGVRGNVVTALYSDIGRASGWTAPRASLAERVNEPLLGLGLAVRVGLSGDLPATAQIPRGLHEATVALDFASVTERVVSFQALSIRRLLIHRGAEFVRPALPAWLARLREADTAAHGRLVQTLRALADADINVQRAARHLRVHANTVYARVQRIQDLTALDAQTYHGLTHLLLAVDCGGF